MIHHTETNYYNSIADQLKVVFDVGCRKDNVFEAYDCEVHQFDPIDHGTATGIFNQVAVTDYNGWARFYNEYSSLRKRTELDGKKKVKHTYFDVPAITLASYCEQYHITQIDLLKIDAEGSDYNVIVGALPILNIIQRIQFEDWVDDSTEKIMELLGNDYHIRPLGGKPLNYIAERTIIRT